MSKILSGPATLAFVGDAYFGLLVRLKLAETERPIGELHSLSVKLVNANAQALGVAEIEPLLTEEEAAVYRRGRNAHPGHTPKNADVGDYHRATGLEALFGYLYLKGEMERAGKEQGAGGRKAFYLSIPPASFPKVVERLKG